MWLGEILMVQTTLGCVDTSAPTALRECPAPWAEALDIEGPKTWATDRRELAHGKRTAVTWAGFLSVELPHQCLLPGELSKRLLPTASIPFQAPGGCR